MQPIDVRGRRLLVVSNPYHTQLKVLAMLNSLNRFGGSHVIPTSTIANVGSGSSLTASEPVSLPNKPTKRGINLPNSKSMSSMGGMMGGMGGGGMF